MVNKQDIETLVMQFSAFEKKSVMFLKHDEFMDKMSLL